MVLYRLRARELRNYEIVYGIDITAINRHLMLFVIYNATIECAIGNVYQYII